MVFKLTSSQKTFYSKNLYDDEKIWCQGVIQKFSKVYSYQQLNDAFNDLVRTQESLLVRFKETDEGGIMKVHPFEYKNYPFINIESEEDFEDQAKKLINNPIDLTGELIRCVIFQTPETSGYIINTHHIIIDGYSSIPMSEHLNNKIKNPDYEAVPTLSYCEYVEKEKQYKESKRFIKNCKFWLEKFDTDPDRELIPKGIGKPDYSASELMRYLPDEFIEKVKSFCKSNNVSVPSFFNLVYAIYFYKKYNKEKFTLGVPVLNRTTQAELNTIGLYMHILPLVVNITDESFLANIRRIDDSHMDLLRYQKFSQYDILELLKQNGKNISTLFDVTADYEEMASNSDYDINFCYNNTLSVSMEIHFFNKDDEHKLLIRYRNSLLTSNEVLSMINSIVALAEDAVSNPDKKISELDVVSQEEKDVLLNTFNSTAAPYEKDKCIHTLFENQAEKTPEKVAVVAKDKTLTYKELNEEANRIAHSLIEKGIGKGDIVGLMLPRRSYLLSALLGILKSGAAYLPVDPDNPKERTEYMLSDSGAEYCITEENVSALLTNGKTENPGKASDSEALCYCIYTSGSTGKPKGTLLSHRNVVNYVSANDKNVFYGVTGRDCKSILSVTTVGFDIFVTESILPLVNGLEIILADEEEAKLQAKLSELVKRNPADVLQTTPTRMKSLMSDKKDLDYLKSFRTIILGGEVLDSSLVKELKAVTDAEIFNIYGPTEATVWMSVGKLENPDDITIGKPMANTRVYILDKYMKLVPVGVTGELCIAGDCVCEGYLNRPELTKEKFIDNPFGEGKLYRTGDNAYFREDGNIVFVGRNDFQVKIRGLRIELGEIEGVLQSVEGTERAVVVVRKDKEDRQLICAFYTGEKKEIKEFREAVGEKLPKYMIPHIFTHLEEMPLTSSGKANRNALPEIDLENISTETEYVAPETEKEEVLAESINEVLGTEKVSMLENFFDIGGDSLKAIELTAILEAKGYEVSIKTVFAEKDVRSLAEKLQEKTTEYVKAEYGREIPATPAQMRVYTAQMLSPESTHYNITYAFRSRSLDKEKLEKAVNKLIERHESLRTHYEAIDGIICQVIDEKAEIRLEKFEDVNTFSKPFDLEKSPMIRVGCNDDTVVIDMHHIAVDGETMPVLFRELNELYMGRELTEEAVQYGEFAAQQKYSEENRNYWLGVFSEEVPELEIPTSYKRGAVQSFKGNTSYSLIEKTLQERIEEKCRERAITPYVYYMACLSVLLSKLSGNEDIVTGSPVSGRTGRFLETAGMFVNTIALRSKPEGRKKISELMEEIRDASIAAIDNQSYPFGELVKELGRDYKGRNPVYDVMLSYQSFEMTDITFADEKAELLPLSAAGAKCDLTFNILPRKNDVVLAVEYCTELFKEERIEKLEEMYKKLLEACLDSEKQICDLTVVTDEEENLLFTFNATTTDYPQDKCIHELFEQQAEKAPDKIAVTAADKALTYKELNEEANRIAHNLIEKGIGKGDIVGLMLPRRSYLLSALLGILKSGAAYLPVDPDNPKERTEYMLSDSGAEYCITEENVSALLTNGKTENPGKALSSEALCYCIYTSGSTGKPKGTLLSHRNVVNYVSANDKNVFYGVTGRDCKSILSVTTVGFDIFVTESILPLVNGLEIVLADEEEAKLQAKLSDLVKRNPADVLQTTPTRMKSLMSDKKNIDYLKSFRTIILGGEVLDSSLVKELKAVTDAEIFNIYGPTEATVWMSVGKLENPDDITIGKPMANTRVYILDKYMKLVPVGVTGELCIGGDCVCEGYLNRPELTKEKFIDNPFGEGKLYRTGDNAYFREDGNIIFVGRNDFQVKIRGLRIELGEIESVLQSVEGTERAVVVVRKDKEDRQLICAFYTGEKKEIKEFREAVGEKLPKYMIPHMFTHLEEMPLTSSGKANRNALPEIDLENISTETEYVAPETEKEEILAESINEVLGTEKVSMLENFFDIGGDSLKTIELTAILEAKGYEVSIKTVFAEKDVRSLAEKLQEKTTEYVKAEYGREIPATPAQMRVYTAQMLSPESTHYNITYAFRSRSLDKEKLEKAVNKLIERHESLRTHYEAIDGIICQVIDEKAEIRLEKLEDENNLSRPFDLEKSPMIRVGCNDDTVVIDMHHIAVDGETMPVLFRELNELYMERELTEEAVQYGEFAAQQKYSEENRNYWLGVFSEEVPELEIPTSYKRGAVQSFKGNTSYSLIEKTLQERIEEKCRERAITPYVYYMACLSVLLSKLSGNEDIVTGSPVSGRTGRFLETAGMFVNTIALRSKPEGRKKISEFMEEIRDASIAAIDNQSYPFGELVKELGRDYKGRNPVYDVMLSYQSFEMTDITFADEKAELLPLSAAGAKCDLTFNILPRKNDVVLAVEYCTELFKKERIEKLEEMYKKLLEACLDSEKQICDLTVITDEEENLLFTFNNTNHTYNIADKSTIYSLFEENAERNKDEICLIAKDRSYTCSDFKAYAEIIDARVREITKGTKSVIAVIAERSVEMYGAVYGIIRGGNAYLPIDPDYPKDRIEYILKNSEAKAVVAQERFGNLAGEVPLINATKLLESNEKAVKTEVLAKEDDTAYVIYTSGSTGMPKGAKVSHKSAVNRIMWMHSKYPMTKDSVILQKTPYTFDVSVWELFWWGMAGGKLAYSMPGEHFLPAKILEEAEKNKVTHLHFVPSVFELFLNYLEAHTSEKERFGSVKYVFLSGEALSVSLVNRFYSLFDSERVSLHNLYGPTECAVDVTYYDCGEKDRTADVIPIGKPIYNTQIHIVDKHTRLVPVGVTGELCIAGANVGQGYLNNPALTKEKFIDNPFGEGKLYKTGDLAYIREDGNIVFVGRNDFQVKIRGLRIELGEIENAVLATDGVLQCAVSVRKDENNEHFLCAFYTGEKKDGQKLRSELSEKLPLYMLPQTFVHLEKMPLTSSGKVNRSVLSQLEVVCTVNEEVYREAETKEEIALSEAVCDVLRLDRVNILDNFFNAGGNSINAIYIVSELEDKGYELRVADIMQKNTFAETARAMKSLSVKARYEQNEVNGLVPFTPIMQAYISEAGDIAGDFTHNCIISAYCDEKSAEKAIDAIVSHHDILRGIFTKKGIEIIPSEERKVYSFDCVEISDKNEALSFLSKTEALTDKNVKVVFCKTEEGNLLSITVHHFLIDLVSWEVLTEDFALALKQLEKGEEIILPAKTADFKFWSNELEKYSENISEESRKYWRSINEKLDKAKALSSGEINEAEAYSFTVDARLTQELIEKANTAYGLRANEITLAALGLAASEITGGDSGITVESHGRTLKDNKMAVERTTGWFTTCYPVVLEKACTEAEALISVKEAVRKAEENAADYLLLNKCIHKNSDIIFNFYHNSVSEEMREKELLAFSAERSLFKNKISVNCTLEKKKLKISVAVLEGKHERGICEKLGKAMVNQLEKLSAICRNTEKAVRSCSDFSDSDLTKKELEELTHIFFSDDIEDIYGLTPSQEGIYAQYYQSTDTKTYQLQNITEIDKKSDLTFLEKSIELLAVRHPVLRTAFTVLKATGEIRQIILRSRKPEIKLVSIEEVFTQEKLDMLASEDLSKAIKLEKDSLFRVTVADFEDKRFILLHTHHIILDGWCFPVIISDLQKYYSKLLSGEKPEALRREAEKESHAETSYAEYAQWLKKQNKGEASEYWRGLLCDCTFPHIYGRENKDNIRNDNIITFTTKLGTELSDSIEDFAKKNRISHNTVFEGAFSVALHKYSASDDIVYDKVISGRSVELKGLESTIGTFINTVPVRVKTKDSFSDLTEEIQKQTLEANSKGILSLSELYRECRTDSKAIDTLFVFENYFTGELSDIEKGALSPEVISFSEQTEFSLTVTILKEKDGYSVRSSYAEEMYSEGEMSEFVKGYISILESAVKGTESISDLTALTTEESALLFTFNNTNHTYNIADKTTIYSLFEENAERNKDEICLVAKDRSYTYSDFKAYAERIDARVREITKGNKSVIAVIAERSAEMYGAVYGIIRGGNAYLPIDPDYPKDRIEYILKNSEARAVVAQECFGKLAGEVPFINATELLESKEEAIKTEVLAKEDDTAYVIYTSGSTGMPKGAKVSHKSAVNRIMWMHSKYPMTKDSVILQKTPYTFDVSVWELFWWGMAGGKLAYSMPGEHFLPAKILEEAEKNKVTHLHFVPSVFELFLNYLEAHTSEKERFGSVKYVFLSGEALSVSLVNRFYSLFDSERVSLHNLYGPTECAVDVTYYDCGEKDRTADVIPIGKPIYNTQIHIVDKHTRLVPVGVTGELCIAGVNVGQGYLNNPELTKEKFIDNPFGEGKLYKTGDLAYIREDGNIIYCGRADNQVKLGGQRIEIGEIESVISSIDAVDSAAVVVSKINMQEALVAFYCSKDDCAELIKDICSSKLPRYMVPSAFIRLDKLPLNHSGKLDRKVLSARKPELTIDDTLTPVNDTERLICKIFSEILGEEKIGRNSDFFELGGSSLGMISLLSEKEFENITAAEFMRNSTPAKLALVMKSKASVKTEYLETLIVSENAEKSLVLLPFAGGGAEAYGKLVSDLRRVDSKTAVYFIRYPDSLDDCRKAAKEISEVLGKTEIYFYSHCVGSAAALQIINHLEENNVLVKHYFAGASIPPAKPLKFNTWRITPDFYIRRTLVKSGADYSGIAADKLKMMFAAFRKNTSLAIVAYAACRSKIKTPVSLLISKKDIFTKNYPKAREAWLKYAETVEDIHFIETDNHYFQNENSKELVDIFLVK